MVLIFKSAVSLLFLSLFVQICKSDFSYDAVVEECKCKYDDYNGKAELLERCQNPSNFPFALLRTEEYVSKYDVFITEIRCICLCMSAMEIKEKTGRNPRRNHMTVIRL